MSAAARMPLLPTVEEVISYLEDLGELEAAEVVRSTLEERAQEVEESRANLQRASWEKDDADAQAEAAVKVCREAEHERDKLLDELEATRAALEELTHTIMHAPTANLAAVLKRANRVLWGQ